MSKIIDQYREDAKREIRILPYRLFKGGKIDVATDKGFGKVELLNQDYRKPIAVLSPQEAVILAEALIMAAEYAEENDQNIPL